MKVYVVTHVVEPYDHEQNAYTTVTGVYLSRKSAEAHADISGEVTVGPHGRETVYDEIEEWEVTE